MPVTAQELIKYGKSSIDLYLKNNPIDSVNPDRPWLKKLMETKKETLGGKDKLVIQVRKGNDSNFQSFYGSDQVTYNRKDTLEQAKYDYVNFHDGFSLHEDDFIRNGVVITEGGPGKRATAMEKATITNLFKEHNETLRQGFEESLDITTLAPYGANLSSLVPNITSNDVVGLHDMVPFDNATGTYAGISRTNAYWQNFSNNAVTTTVGDPNNILTQMRKAWRACIKYGGRPDCILVGSAYLDAYVDYMLNNFGRVDYAPIAKKGVEGAEGEVYYQGVPVVWCPTFDLLDGTGIGEDASNPNWSKRCYFINTRFLKLMPIKGQHMVTRTPPRTYNKYEYYWALTTRFYLVNSRPTAHAVLGLA
ncbi:MAG TPA: phage major capsid protein [Acidobacteria bacterium]|nr:phage major capsid protein [Acidobacteriota bacterium]